jgi:hypothetical protein
LNARPGNHVIHPPAIEGRNELQLYTTDGSVESGGSSGVADVHVTRSQTGYQNRTAAYEDELGINAVLCEEALLLRDPNK